MLMISILWENIPTWKSVQKKKNIPTFIISYKKYKIEKRDKNLYESKRHDDWALNSFWKISQHLIAKRPNTDRLMSCLWIFLVFWHMLDQYFTYTIYTLYIYIYMLNAIFYAEFVEFQFFFHLCMNVTIPFFFCHL